jgi:shikimate kinase
VADATVGNILLMGPRASGKTTIGEMLAQRLHRPFIDLDRETLRSFADVQSVAEAWQREGEARWREAEYAALVSITQRSGQVIALGGGTPMIEPVQPMLEQHLRSGSAVHVYLDCPVDMLKARLTAMPGDRPALLGDDAVAEVERVLRARRPVYQRLATMTVDAALPPATIVETILRRLPECQ